MSLAASAGVNALVIVAIAVWTADARNAVQDSLAKAVTREEPSLVFLAPVMEALKPKPEPAPEPQAPQLRKNTVDTAPAQEAEAPERRTAESECNTRATSNAPAVQGAPDQPSLRGREMDDGDKRITYRSQYKEGDIDHAGRGDGEHSDAVTPPAPEAAAPATPAPSAGPAGQPKPQAALPGTAPVERAVPKPPDVPPIPNATAIPETPPLPQDAKPKQEEGISVEAKPTQSEGSVTAVGAGSQEASDTPEARYVAMVRRSVERYWQADRVRSRDFDMAGAAVVHVVIDSTGKVPRATFEEEYGFGMVQKGFISSSIKDHQHPPMPADLKKKLKGRPFEFNIKFTVRS
ncbi:MAG: hypothetical protein JWO82_3327 [Akkermansiaceae bacterium]|nr:hypothetical protein [Akkermansiaceae bacterium]